MNDAEKAYIREHLIDGDSIPEISKAIDKPYADVRSAIKTMGLNWLIASNRSLSKGHGQLLELFKRLIPNTEIVTEHHLGNGLYLDIYCPSLNIGAEFHGRQHFEYVSHFHNTKADFKRGQTNDRKKIARCEELGIALVVVCYNEDLSLDMVSDKILSAIQQSQPATETKPKSSLSSDSDYYQKMKVLRNERRRETYRRIKRGKID